MTISKMCVVTASKRYKLKCDGDQQQQKKQKKKTKK